LSIYQNRSPSNDRTLLNEVVKLFTLTFKKTLHHCIFKVKLGYLVVFLGEIIIFCVNVLIFFILCILFWFLLKFRNSAFNSSTVYNLLSISLNTFTCISIYVKVICISSYCFYRKNNNFHEYNFIINLYIIFIIKSMCSYYKEKY
jgi:hypothetical protein